MKNQVDTNLLRRYTQGSYSRKEYQQVLAWFGEERMQNEIEPALRQHWDELESDNSQPQRNLDKVYENVTRLIHLEETNPHLQLRRFFNNYSRVAAILLLPLMLFSLYLLNQQIQSNAADSWVEIYSPPGARTRFSLPDGSSGWLNSNSRLKYKADFQKRRQLQLFGQAYFEAAKNKKSPFVVETPNLQVQVLGTIFTVTAHQDDPTTEVVLQEGKVVVEMNDGCLKTELKPDERLILNNESQQFTTTSIDAEQYNSWKNGLLAFRNEPLGEVFKQLGRWYNVKITVEDDKINQYKYRATFRNEPVEEVIRLIALTVPFNYRIEERQQGNLGEYAVKEIVISRK